ncbi:MAG: hypothetical protein VCE43_01590 [Myxococcota bacterium]
MVNGIMRQFAFLLVLVAVPVITWYFVFQPQNRMIEDISKDIRIRQEKLEEVENMAANLHDLEDIVRAGMHAIELTLIRAGADPEL